VVRAEAGHGIGTVELFHQGVERALEIAHRDALVDDKALDLVEHRGMGRVDLVLAVHAARGQNADRRAGALHHAHLHRGGLAAEMDLLVLGDIERVRPLADGVVLRDVQTVKVVVGKLDLRAVHDGKAHADEYINDFVEHGVHNVLLAERDLLAGHRHVERFGAELCLLQTRGKRALAAFDLVFQLAADLVRKLADHGTLLGGELAHLFQNGGQLTLFAEIPDAQRFERVHVHGFFDRLTGRFPQVFQHFLHGFLLY